MEFNKYIQTTIQQIKAEQDRRLSNVKEVVTREKIIPYNQEIDRVKRESICQLDKWLENEKSALTGDFNEKLNALQEKYNKDKQTINETAEKKKTDNAEAVIATSIYEITKKCENKVAQLLSMIEEE